MTFRYKQPVVLAKILAASIVAAMIALSGCGKEIDETEVKPSQEEVQLSDQAQNTESDSNATDSTDAVSAQTQSLDVDFNELQAKNPDVFAWIKIPGTNIDMPVLRSEEDDAFYVTHDADKNPSADGAAYVEMANFPEMCDFNTVIHGSKAMFSDLINFENPDYFDKNDTFYIYLPDNVLTYTIWTAYKRENNSMLRTYDFADAKGCRAFLDDVYNGRYIGKQIRDGWYDLDEYKFIVTLTIDDPASNDQLVVMGALVNDAAGNINREVIEELEYIPDLFNGEY
jgi:sortase B